MLSESESEADSKFGDDLNFTSAVTESVLEIVNRLESFPLEIVTVADSESLIVAAAVEIAVFSAKLKEEDEVKVGAVASID